MERSGAVNLEGITFDVGGTLLEPWPSVGHLYAEVAGGFGWKLAPELLDKRFAAVWRSKPGFDYTLAAWEVLVGQTFAGLIPGVPGVDFFEALHRRFEQPGAWRVFEDARPTLERLRRGGFKLGAISNWDDRLRALLERLELAPFFEAILVSAEVGAAKPSPEIFQRAAKMLGLAPSAILHVGDSLEEDFRGAQAAGFRALLLCRSGPVQFPGAIATLAELPGGIKRPPASSRV